MYMQCSTTIIMLWCVQFSQISHLKVLYVLFADVHNQTYHAFYYHVGVCFGHIQLSVESLKFFLFHVIFLLYHYYNSTSLYYYTVLVRNSEDVRVLDNEFSIFLELVRKLPPEYKVQLK